MLPKDSTCVYEKALAINRISRRWIFVPTAVSLTVWVGGKPKKNELVRVLDSIGFVLYEERGPPVFGLFFL